MGIHKRVNRHDLKRRQRTYREWLQGQYRVAVTMFRIAGFTEQANHWTRISDHWEMCKRERFNLKINLRDCGLPTIELEHQHADG